ncbi:MAG: T9SS type A sorting domain-containing protein [Bacteroidia bacterium]|nr:T9SS type A sorting domain-containing protein [Bacteroidia bacterium]
MKRILFPLLLILVFNYFGAGFLKAQNMPFALRSQDSTYLGHPIQLKDGRIATIMGTWKGDSTDGGGVAFFDSLGNFLQSTSIGKAQGGEYLGPDIIQDDEDNLVLLFTNISTQGIFVYDFDIRMVKIRPDGSILWDITLADSVSLLGAQVIQAANGDYLVVGTGFLNINAQRDLYLARIQRNGVPLWGKLIGSNASELGASIVELPSGDLILLGRYIGVGSIRTEMIRTGPGGNVKWGKVFGKQKHHHIPGGMILDSRGTLAFTGFSSLKYSSWQVKKKTFICRADTNGNLLWTRTYDGPWYEYENGRCILETPDQGYVMAGNTDFPYGGASVARSTLLIKTDSNGAVLHAANLGILGEDHVWLNSHSDGGYLVGAVRFWIPPGTPSSNQRSHGWLFKTGPDLLIGCLDSNRTADYSDFLINPGDSQLTINSLNHVDVVESDSAYQVLVSTQFMCGMTGLKEPRATFSLRLYPNPARDQVWLEGDARIQPGQNYELILLDLQGRKVKQEKGRWPTEERLSLDADDLPAGLFLVELRTTYGRWSGKLVRE